MARGAPPPPASPPRVPVARPPPRMPARDRGRPTPPRPGAHPLSGLGTSRGELGVGPQKTSARTGSPPRRSADPGTAGPRPLLDATRWWGRAHGRRQACSHSGPRRRQSRSAPLSMRFPARGHRCRTRHRARVGPPGAEREPPRGRPTVRRARERRTPRTPWPPRSQPAACARSWHRGLRSCGPLGVLKHDAIAVCVLERAPYAVPVWVERGDRIIASREQLVHRPLPCLAIGLVEDEQIVLCRCGACGVAVLASELEVIGAARDAQHDAVEAIVVLEGAEAGEPEPVGVEPHDVFQMVGGPGHPERRFLLHHMPSTLTVIVVAADTLPQSWIRSAPESASPAGARAPALSRASAAR